jgi:tetratricopeptide (TPR) repeat protein
MRAPHRWVALLALLGTAVTVPALAQQRVEYPKCDHPVTDRDSDAAHGAYLAGMAAYQEGDYDKALLYFNDAYKRDCEKHEMLIIISRAHEGKGDKQEAIRLLKLFLERAPNHKEAETTRAKIANLEKLIAQEKPQPTSTASAPPTATAAPTPPPPPSADTGGGGHTLPPWIVVGVGGALAVVGGILQPIAYTKISDAESLCRNRECPPDAKVDGTPAVELGNSGRSLSAVGVGLIVGGLVLVAGGLTWHFLEPTGPKTTARITPSVGPGFAGMQLGGRF